MSSVVHCNYEVATVLRVPPSDVCDDDRWVILNAITTETFRDSSRTWDDLCETNLLGALNMTFESGELICKGRWSRTDRSRSASKAVVLMDSIGFDRYEDATRAYELLSSRIPHISTMGDILPTLKVYRRISSYRSLCRWIVETIKKHDHQRCTIKELLNVYNLQFDDSICAMASRFKRPCIGNDEDTMLDLVQSMGNQDVYCSVRKGEYIIQIFA